jgi:hypothetical protein
VHVLFSDPELARVCSSGIACKHAWEGEATDVQCALSLLADVDDLEAYGRLPNVTTRGATTVFRGMTSSVQLSLRETKEAGDAAVIVTALEVRATGSGL